MLILKLSKREMFGPKYVSLNSQLKRICILKPMLPEHQIIHLQGGLNVIGRQRETGIRDEKCSRKQMELNVDMDKALIKLKILGINPSGVNGLMALQHSECELRHGDVIEIVFGRHPFEVQFKPLPEQIRKSEIDQCYEKYDDVWSEVENGKMLVFTSKGVRSSPKIACYDVDGTIIRTKSGNVFPKTCDDWMLNYPEVPKKLKSLFEDGFKICFFTNQGGIAKGKTDLNEFKQKVMQIIAKLQVPVQAFIAITDGYYRKPLPGMWEHLQKTENNSVTINKDKSFFVGDAAGRPEVGKGKAKRRKDHSLADRLFAKNIGITFYTPEEHFLNVKKEEWIRPDFDPTVDLGDQPLLEPAKTKIPHDKIEIIVMVGLPGSEFAKYHQHNTKCYIVLPLFLSLSFNRRFQCVEILERNCTKIKLPSSLIHLFMLKDYNCKRRL
ncbi:polynucleotide kinase 3'-phosphatase isoform X2 [Haematobia irritans]|uniref:polynucleotide kinase 3'-phosphatase isoform X2 n=1 Tax=Haematobia irritans TaxID=7368 RepID=UPI003F4F5FAB